VLKKAGVAVCIAAAALVALTPLAFADDDSDGGPHFQFLPGVQDHVYQHPEKVCNQEHFEGVYGFPRRGNENSDSHDGDCDQDNSASGYDD